METSKSIASAATEAIYGRAARGLLVIAVALATLLGGVSVAAAGRNVVVRDFTGPKAKKIRADVVKVLKSRGHNIVPLGEFEDARQRLGGGEDADSISKAAASVSADAVVEGTVRRPKRRVSLRLELRSGTTGEVVDSVNIALGRRPVLRKPKKRVIARKFSAMIDDLPGVVVDEVADEPADEPVEVAQAETSEDPFDDASAADLEDEADSSPLSESERYNSLTRNRAIDMAIGVSATGRSLRFALTGDANVSKPNEYSGSIVPGAVIAGEVYPMMFFTDRRDPGVLANIGISFLYDRVLLINSQLEDAAGDAADIDTTQSRLHAGLLYRWNFGDSPTSPQLKFGAGYGMQEFSLDIEGAGLDRCMDAGENPSPAGCVDLPDVNYSFLSGMVGGRYGLTPKVALLAEARILFVTDAGDIEAEGSYGDASSLGFDVDLGAEYRLFEAVVLRINGRYQRFSLDFTESNPITDRDGDNMFDVDSAADNYFGVVVSAGYLY